MYYKTVLFIFKSINIIVTISHNLATWLNKTNGHIHSLPPLLELCIKSLLRVCKSFVKACKNNIFVKKSLKSYTYFRLRGVGEMAKMHLIWKITFLCTSIVCKSSVKIRKNKIFFYKENLKKLNLFQVGEAGSNGLNSFNLKNYNFIYLSRL